MAKTEKISSYSRFAVLLFTIGGLFAVDSLFHLSFIYKLWPLIITMLGIGFIGIFKTRDRKESLYLSVGIYLVCFSFLALFCDFTNWAILKSFWPIFIAFLGISITFSYALCQKKTAWLLAGLLLLSTSAVFFLVFSVSKELWWSVFLLAGMSVWIAERDAK